MRSLLSIVQRNMKVIYRSKVSSLLVLIAPIIIVFLIGSAFNSNSFSDIKVGTYAQEYSELVVSINDGISENEFEVYRMDNEEICIEKIKQGEIHVCVLYPESLSMTGSNQSIEIVIDNSRMNIASSLTNSIDSKISAKGTELGLVMLNDILNVLKDIKTSLPENKAGVQSAISSLEDLNSKSSSLLSITSLNTQISTLEIIEVKLKSENISSTITNAAKDLNSTIKVLKEYKATLNSSLNGISSQGLSSKANLSIVSYNIDSLINKILNIGATDAENIISPIKTEINPLAKDSTNWKYLYPTLVALILLLSGIVLSSSIVLTERKERARFRNFMTPTSDLSFILGAYVTGLIILLVQVMILFLGTALLTDLNVFPSLGSVALIIIISSSVFLFIGMVIGYIFKSDETTVLAAISVAALLIFFSNAIVPAESIRGVFKYFAHYNPFYVSDILLKRGILFNESVVAMLPQIGILVAVLVIFLIACLFARKMTKRAI